MSEENYLSVSKMAEIHGLSRQTLIFYDKIGLFCPAVVTERGYRYYTYTQIPYLREICFLKSVGVKLEDIKQQITRRDTDTALDLLLMQQSQVAQQIATLAKVQQNMTERIQAYCHASPREGKVYESFLATKPHRVILFSPWGTDDVERTVLHTTLMKSWVDSETYNVPPCNWGAVLRHDALRTSAPLRGAGAYVDFAEVPVLERDRHRVIHLEAGEYACLYHYDMPYELGSVYRLLEWVEANGYEVTGDIVDRCLLDTTFYSTERCVDFCEIQVPVRRREVDEGAL